jgi:DNA-3-methyladenine glycosylase II
VTPTFEIEVKGPYRLDLTAWALRRRPHNEIDDWDGHRFRRVLVLDGSPTTTEVRQAGDGRRPALEVTLTGVGRSPSDRAVAEARAALIGLLGLHVDLGGFYELAGRDARLTALAERFVGMRPVKFPSVFEAVVNAVACQQLTLTAGIHRLSRLARAYGRSGPGGGTAFPDADQLAEAQPVDIRELGFSTARAGAIVSLARAFHEGDFDVEALGTLDDDGARRALTALAGLGRWSADYTLLRGLGRWHVLPGDDVAAQNNLRRRLDLPAAVDHGVLSRLAAEWWPWGGVVYFNLLLDSLVASGVVRTGPVQARSSRHRNPVDGSSEPSSIGSRQYG